MKNIPHNRNTLLRLIGAGSSPQALKELIQNLAEFCDPRRQTDFWVACERYIATGYYEHFNVLRDTTGGLRY